MAAFDFFAHPCFLHCTVPCIRTSNGNVVTVAVPWARPGSGFTLLCEAFAMALIERGMLVSRVAQMLGVYGQRIWTLFSYWIAKARQADRVDSVTRLGVDDPVFRCAYSHVSN